MHLSSRTSTLAPSRTHSHSASSSSFFASPATVSLRQFFSSASTSCVQSTSSPATLIPVTATSSATSATESSSRTHASSLGDALRPQFPILNQQVNGFPLVYLDSAATSQKPTVVLDAMQNYYLKDNSNVHRGVHTLSARATDAYEAARERVGAFINASSGREIVFTRNASEAINLVAYSWGLAQLKEGDEVVLSVAEHHSNLVPWQLIAKKTGASLRFADLTSDETQVDLTSLLSLIGPKTKLVAIHHVSNTLGSIVNASLICEAAHAVGAKLLLDACQSVPHLPIDVQQLPVDFLVASSHKMCGPTGLGFLYAPMELLQQMPPFQGGGEMISDVFLDHSTYAEPPSRFEAGTPAIAEAVGLGAAVDFLTAIGMQAVHEYEMELAGYLYQELSRVDGVQIYGPPVGPSNGRAAALCAFNVKGIHATDLSTFLDQQHGIAIRSGHHCTQPLHRRLQMNASARASMHVYNTKADVDAFVEGLKDTINFFRSFD